MTTVAGLDGCRGGWCAVELDVQGDTVAAADPLIRTFSDVVASQAEIVCVDIPIGLLDGPGRRNCDTAARKLLGRPRASSVFPSPCRSVLSMDLSAEQYAVVSIENKRRGDRKLTKQTYNIAPKIRDVDLCMTPELQRRVREVHPEVCFWALNNGYPMEHNKKRLRGRLERWTLLRRHIRGLPPMPSIPREMRPLCAIDDYVDALAAAWTAVCITRGARAIPETPAYDGHDLRMEMWFPEPVIGSPARRSPSTKVRRSESRSSTSAFRFRPPPETVRGPSVPPASPVVASAEPTSSRGK
jgi:predicted RNase H-like nuclease